MYMIHYKLFRSESGDWFRIPPDQYDKEVEEYTNAVQLGDEKKVLHFEEGYTGWRYYEG